MFVKRNEDDSLDTRAWRTAVIEDRVGVVDSNSPFRWVFEDGIDGMKAAEKSYFWTGHFVWYTWYEIVCTDDTMIRWEELEFC